MEYQTRAKTRTESWPDFGEDLRDLVDKAYPSLDDEARQQLALQWYLSQLDNEQIAFGVKQRKPKTIEAAVGATIELESYLVKLMQGVVAPVRVEPKDTLLEMMEIGWTNWRAVNPCRRHLWWSYHSKKGGLQL